MTPLVDQGQPPYPEDTRAKGWRFELDHERIRQSDTWALAPAEIRPWLLMLWMVAWEQTPCGSLPANDELIAARMGMQPKAFAKARPALMRGWWAADDGRLYHDTLAERVTEMMTRRRKESDRKALARQRTPVFDPADSDGCPNAVPPLSHGTDAGLHPESDTGTGTREELSTPSVSHPLAVAKGAGKPALPCPYDAIVAAYHEALPSLPAVRLMGEPRKKAMRKVWGWVLGSTKPDGTRRATTADEALAWFGAYFARASDNDFLMGRGARSSEHAGWQCDIDFLLTDKGMKHVIEKTLEAA